MKKLLFSLTALAAVQAALAFDIVPVDGDKEPKHTWHVEILPSGGIEVTGIDPKPINSISIPTAFFSETETYPIKRIGSGAFANCIGLTSVTIADTVEEIGDFAFSNCTSLAEIKLPYGLRRIGRRPFVNTLIKEIELPDSLYDMDGNIAAGCINQLSITIPDEESHFAIGEDGALYNKKMTKLYSCPCRKEGPFVVPDSVTEIGPDAFFGCFRLTSISIGPQVAVIGENAFDVAGIWPSLLPAPEATPMLQEIIYTEPDQEEDNPSPTDPVYLADGWHYSLSASGKATLVSADGKAGEVTIPAELDGHPVTGIAGTAFDNCTGITLFKVEEGCAAAIAKNLSLYSPDGKTLIRVPDAFTLPATVTETISEFTISETVIPAINEDGTDGTKTTTVSSSPKSTSKSKQVAPVVTPDTLFNGVKSIADHAFFGCAQDDTVVEAESNSLNSTTGFIGGNAYLKVTYSVTEKKTQTTYDLKIPSSITYSDKAFEGSGIRPVVARTGDMRTQPVVPPVVVAPQFAESTKYIGYVTRDGVITGIASLKTGKMRDGVLKASGKVTTVGQKATTVRSLDNIVPAGCEVVWANDLSATKTFDGFKGKVWTLALQTLANGGNALANGYSTFTVSVAAKGKAKVTGYLADGTKVTATAQMMLVDGQYLVPVVAQGYAGKEGGLAFLMTVDTNGSASVSQLSDLTMVAGKKTSTVTVAVADVGKPATAISKGIDFDPSALPDGYTFDETAASWRPRYTAKTGVLQGTLKVLSGARKVSAKVYGVMVDGIGYGTAVIKKSGSWAVALD